MEFLSKPLKIAVTGSEEASVKNVNGQVIKRRSLSMP